MKGLASSAVKKERSMRMDEEILWSRTIFFFVFVPKYFEVVVGCWLLSSWLMWVAVSDDDNMMMMRDFHCLFYL